MSDKPVSDLSFEEAMAELENLVSRLEGSQVAATQGAEQGGEGEDEALVKEGIEPEVRRLLREPVPLSTRR